MNQTPSELAELSIEEIGLHESDALQTSPGQKLFGWGLGLLSLAIVVGVGAVAAVVLTYVCLLYTSRCV